MNHVGDQLSCVDDMSRLLQFKNGSMIEVMSKVGLAESKLKYIQGF